MSENTIRWEQDADGIVTLTLDDPNQRANTMNDDFRSSLTAVADRLVTEKDTFFAGGDLNLLIQVTDDNAAEFAAGVEQIKADLRKIETLGKPVVAALNGAAHSGGPAIEHDCPRRIALDNQM